MSQWVEDSRVRHLVVDTLNILIVHFFKPERFLIQLSCNRIEYYEQREVTLLYVTLPFLLNLIMNSVFLHVDLQFEQVIV